VRPRGHFLNGPASGWGGVGPSPFTTGSVPIFPTYTQAITMRRLEEYEEIGLIGYPCDGEYIAVLGGRENQNWLLGGELCGLGGAVLADQAADLPKYYPQGARLVLVTIRDNWVVALRDYNTAEIGLDPN